ncbi:hypothetical protein NBRC116583_01640 [Arenicella sp. 4NH20-0111]|uniref:Sec-independent protein translocase protein TatB n=1 Tax=Arenicella sp. 4NH20-0111 TaxID=3127648 RepID=UPI00310A395F
MLDIGFSELLVIGVVLLLVMGPERLPEVAKQIAFFIRKARQGVYRLRSEMQDEIDGSPFADLEAAKREISDLKNDLRQFGRDLADSAEQDINHTDSQNSSAETIGNAVAKTESKGSSNDVHVESSGAQIPKS